MSNKLIEKILVYDGQQSLPPAGPSSTSSQLEKQQQNKNRKNTRELLIDTECNDKSNKIQMQQLPQPPPLQLSSDAENKVIYFIFACCWKKSNEIKTKKIRKINYLCC